MISRKEIKQRTIERAAAAGERWSRLGERRAETVRRLIVGGPMSADSPERVARYQEREAAKRLAILRAGLPATILSERRIGPTLDLDDDPPTDAARVAGRPVGRIVGLDARGDAMDGFATGFLIADGLLITNHHVFATAEEVDGCGVQFGYDRVNGVVDNGIVLRLDAGHFFLSDADLDYAIVGVVPDQRGTLASLRTLPFDPMTGKILVGQPISIIQHPNGGPKKYGVRDNELLIAPSEHDLFLQYTTDTLPGSSGSPAFNKDWEVVALHASGVPEVKDGAIMTIRGEPWRRGMSDDEIHWVANEGARVSCIYQSLKSKRPSSQQEAMYQQLMKSFGEDFSTLPALNTNLESGAMDPVTGGTGRVTINIAGPGNFYFGGQSDHAAAPVVTPPPRPPTPVPAREKKIVFDLAYKKRPGYQENFLGIHVPLPGADGREAELLKKNNAVFVLDYHHYSIVMNEEWRMPMWAAANVDYTKAYRRKSREEFGEDTWVPDPRIRGEQQIMDQEMYAPAKKFDRGHIIRRDDVAWGVTAKEEVYANSDSFHWTNCTPQHEAFNRDMFEYSNIGVWGMLENHIAQQARNVGNRLTIFAGPMLTDDHIEHDFGGGTVYVPLRFWKVVIVAENADTPQRALKAYGFILDQQYAVEEYGLELKEKFDVGDFRTYHYSLDAITKESGVTFDDVIMNADALVGAADESKRILLKSLEDLRI